MARLIFLGLIIAVIFYFVKRYLSKKTPPDPAHDQPTQADTENVANTEDMVQCATCQVHVTRAEAFLLKQHFYCCQAHIPKK